MSQAREGSTWVEHVRERYVCERERVVRCVAQSRREKEGKKERDIRIWIGFLRQRTPPSSCVASAPPFSGSNVGFRV